MRFTRKLLSLLLAVLVLGTLWSTPTAAADEAALSQDPIEGFVTRTYVGVLGRQPEPGGFNSWVTAMNWSQPNPGERYQTWRSRVERPLDRLQVIEYFLDSPEFQTVMTSEANADFLTHLYREVHDRAPDGNGFNFWKEQLDQRLQTRAQVVLHFIESDEMLTRTSTRPFEPPAHWSTRFLDQGFVDAGHGVYLPTVMLQVRFCESTNNYAVENPSPRSSASGAYQFLTGSWDDHGHAREYGTTRAMYATPSEQDEAALITWLDRGTRPWNASRHCWGFAS